MNDVLDSDIRAALADLLDTAPDVPTRPPVADPDRLGGSAAPDRRPVIAAAAVLVLVGVFGLVQVTRPDDPPQQGTLPAPTVPPTISSSPLTAAPPAVTTVPDVDPEASPSTVPALDLDDPPGVFLPASIPDGYVIGFVDVLAPSAMVPGGMTSRYFVRSEAGRPVASITFSVVPAPSPTTEPPPSGGPTVHGQVATSFDSGQGWVVSWVEAGLYASVRAIGLDEGTVLAIAESTVVSGGNAPSIDLPKLPEGFELSAADAAPMTNQVTSLLQLLPQPAVPGVFADISAYPNVDQFSIDTLEVQYTTLEGTMQRVVVRGNEGLLHTSPTDRFGTMSFVTWIEGASIVSVEGRLPLDELLALAATVGPDSLQRAKALRPAADDALLALEVFDRAVLPSGIEAVVVTDGNGATGICAFATGRPDSATCGRHLTEGSLAGERQDIATATLVIDGEPVGIGWALGEHAPRYQDSGTTEPLTDVAVTGVGTFLAVPLDAPEGATFVFDEGANTIYTLTAGPDSLLD